MNIVTLLGTPTDEPQNGFITCPDCHFCQDAAKAKTDGWHYKDWTGKPVAYIYVFRCHACWGAFIIEMEL